MSETLYYSAEGLQDGLSAALGALAEEYPLREGEGSPAIEFRPGLPEGELKVSREGETVRVSYGALTDALRGVGAALAGLFGEGGSHSETRPFSTLGVMLDCSRNAVMRVEHVRNWLRRLALFGFNMLMLYTEDTYALPGEPFFGFMRGGYSREELKEVDEYAARLGIETVACIQTLGHLGQILKWNVYSRVKDTGSVLLAGEPKTYELIRKMVSACAGSLRSRRIHVGMDEAHDLGRGQYLDRHGYKRGFDIFNEHLKEVIDICREHDLKPMIWSDMYFRLGSKTGGYYDPESVIPEDAKAAIPKDVELVYWDYYHDKEPDYLDMIERHRALGHEPVVGSGVWTWSLLWYGRGITERAAGACVRACRRAGLKELFFTMWGDDGGYCEFDSALAGLAFAAELSWGGDDGERLRRRYEAVCGLSYEDTLLGSAIEDPTLGGRLAEGGRLGPACNILWDDPLLGVHWLAAGAKVPGIWEKALEHYREVSGTLEAFRGRTEPVDLDHAAALARFLSEKIELRLRLEEAYGNRDSKAMETVAERARRMAGETEALEASFRRQWHRRNKPFGFETMQIRLGGLRQRFLEVERRLRELLEGRSEGIAELDEGRSIPKEALASFAPRGDYRGLATASSIL